MDTAGGWGKPLKKTKDPVKEPAQEPIVDSTPETKAGPAKISTKSEPFVQETKLEPIDIAARAREGLHLVNDSSKDYASDTSGIICDEATISLFSSDGDILAFANPYRIGAFIFSEANGLTYDLPNVLAMRFSTGLRYLFAIDKRENKHYITIFEARTLNKILEYETTKYKKETWPFLKFVGDDELAFRAPNPQRIEVLDPKKNFEIIRVIETKPFDFFAVSNKRENLIIVCVTLEHTAGYDKNEGRVDVFEYDNIGPKPLISKIIDKAHEVNLFFSPTETKLLVWAQTFTDKTGQSYYGEHYLLYLDLERKSLRRVPTYKGPIHDVAWNPNGSEFIVISGFMPASSVLFTRECVPKFEFGNHHKNTIKWSPLSRFICIAGFGNLSGEMEMWDVTNLQKVGTCKSNSAVSCLWAPDGRRIMTGVLNPRLRVDNGYKIFKYTGELLLSVDFSHTELYEVVWRPGQYADKPCSPLKKPEKKEEETTGPKLFRPKGTGTFAAQLNAQKNAKIAGRFLDPDEIFNNEANIEVEEKKEEPKKKKRIRKKKDKKGGDEEGKDDGEGDEEA